MTEKNPPIPQGSESFRHSDGEDQVFLPSTFSAPHHGGWVSLDDVKKPELSLWPRWITAMAIEDLEKDLVSSATRLGKFAYAERLDETIRAQMAWRAWGKT